jgi:hypothetical protein
MKTMLVAVVAALASAASFAQTGTAPSIRTPVDPGMSTSPDKSMKAPSNSGMVVVPPKTDPEAIVTPPKQVDPKIDDATPGVDRKNAEKSQDKKSR